MPIVDIAGSTSTHYNADLGLGYIPGFALTLGSACPLNTWSDHNQTLAGPQVKTSGSISFGTWNGSGDFNQYVMAGTVQTTQISGRSDEGARIYGGGFSAGAIVRDNLVRKGILTPKCLDLHVQTFFDNENAPFAILLGGNRCKVAAFTFFVNATTGSQRVDIPGIYPHLLNFIGVDQYGVEIPEDTRGNGTMFDLGWCDRDLNQWAIAGRSKFESGCPTISGFLDGYIQRSSRFFNDACIASIGSVAYARPTTTDIKAAVTEIHPGYIILNVTATGIGGSGTNGGLQAQVSLLAIEFDSGQGWGKVGIGTEGDTSFPGLPGTPDYVFLGSNGATNTSLTTECRLSIGASDGTKSRSAWMGAFSDVDAAHCYVAGKDTVERYEDGLIFFADPTGGAGSATLLARATVDSSFNISWPTGGTGGRKYGWVAFQCNHDTNNRPPCGGFVFNNLFRADPQVGASAPVSPTTAKTVFNNSFRADPPTFAPSIITGPVLRADPRTPPAGWDYTGFAYKIIDTDGTGLDEIFVEITAYIPQWEIDDMILHTTEMGDLFELWDLYGQGGNTPGSLTLPQELDFGNYEGLEARWRSVSPFTRWATEADSSYNTLIAGGNHTITLHVKLSTDVYVYVIDGVTFDRSGNGDFVGWMTQIDAVSVGNIFGNYLSYIRSAKFGSSVGASDIAGNGTFTDLTGWDGVTDAAVVASFDENDGKPAGPAPVVTGFGVTTVYSGSPILRTPFAPTILLNPRINGPSSVGVPLPITPGSLSPPASSTMFQWQTSTDGGTTWQNIAGETTPIYTPVMADNGNLVRATTIAVSGSNTSNPIPTNPVVVGGTPPTPPATGKTIGVIYLGGGYPTLSNKANYGTTIVSAEDMVAASSYSRALVYQNAQDTDTRWVAPVDYGLPYSLIRDNGWLALHAGSEISEAPGGFSNVRLADISDPGYRSAWVSNVINKCQTNGIDGVFIDNVLKSPAGLTGGVYPDNLPNADAWTAATIGFLAYAFPRFVAAGLYIMVNATSYYPGHPGNYDSGATDISWWAQLSPYVHGLCHEYYPSTNDSSDSLILRSSGTAAYSQFWDQWQGLITTAESYNCDFVGLIYGSHLQNARFAKFSFLMEWNGTSGSFVSWGINGPGGGGDPWNTAWTFDPGTPTAAKTIVSPGVQKRTYTLGTAYVNATTSSVVVDGHTIPAQDGLFV